MPPLTSVPTLVGVSAAVAAVVSLQLADWPPDTTADPGRSAPGRTATRPAVEPSAREPGPGPTPGAGEGAGKGAGASGPERSADPGRRAETTVSPGTASDAEEESLTARGGADEDASPTPSPSGSPSPTQDEEESDDPELLPFLPDPGP